MGPRLGVLAPVRWLLKKAGAFLGQREQLFYPYKQTFNHHLALLGCMFFLGAAFGVIFKPDFT